MQRPVNENASSRACELLEYLYSISGNKIITGQHTQTNPMEETEYIKEHTGKEPKLRGFEMLGYSPNINYDDADGECLKEVEENKGTMKTALEWAKNNDGIVTITFHWFSPIGGRDKSFYSDNTDFDARNVFKEGSAERQKFFSDMDVIAVYLKEFRDADIPILWRPFHESEGTWFWWGKYGPEIAGELYKLMYDYYVNVHKLDNLLWVWNCPRKEGYPGDEYVDVVSADIYLEKYKPTDYEEEYKRLVEATSDKKIAALAEIGYLPDVEMLEKSHTPWAYYMTWSGGFAIGERFNSLESLKKMYDSDYSIKL